MEAFLGVFAAIGIIAVIVVAAIIIRGRSGNSDQPDTNAIFRLQEAALLETIAARDKPHSDDWRGRYSVEFDAAFTVMFGAAVRNSLKESGVIALPSLFQSVREIPDDELEARWQLARQRSAEHPDAGSPQAVFWNLTWLILGGELLWRMAPGRTEKERAAGIMMTAGTVIIPGVLKSDGARL